MADASFDFRITRYRPNRQGIEEVWKGAAMRDVLRGVAVPMGEEANAMAHLHGQTPDRLYEAGVDVLDHTAVGYVETTGWLGRVENGAHHTLDALNH